MNKNTGKEGKPLKKRRLAMSLGGVIVFAYKWKLGKFKYIRICTDLVCVVLGTAIFLMGGGTWAEVPTVVGIGTIITAFFMGPLIEYFNEKVARPLLKKE